MLNLKQRLADLWLKAKQGWLTETEDSSVALDQVSRFYQSDFYLSLDKGLRSAFYDGPLGGLDSRVIERQDVDFLLSCHGYWQNGRNVSCAIFGEKGTGLSTLLNMFTAKLKQQDQAFKSLILEKRLCSEQDVINSFAKLLGMENKDYTFDEFIILINQLPPCVITLDNLHFLVQRTLDAQVVVDTLSAIILASRGYHLWIVACEEQAWRRLCYGYQIEHVFSHQQQVANFSESQMLELLLKRFSYGGFRTINDMPIETLVDGKCPLNDIAKRCKGCIELSLFYCLNNLSYGITEKSVCIMPAEEIDVTALKSLSQLELFSLAEICAHGHLSVKEHHKIFRISLGESKMILEHLRVLGILDKNEGVSGSDAYSLKLIISAVVIRYLISMNSLY